MIISRKRALSSKQARKLVYPLFFFLVLAVYYLTFSKVPTSDGLTWARQVQNGSLQDLFSPHHLMYKPLGFALYRLLLSTGLKVDVIRLLQVMNALIGSFGAIVFLKMIMRITNSLITGLISSFLLAFSHGYWYFLNGEIHVFGVVFLILSFYLLLFGTGKPHRVFATIGLTNGLAVLFHQENLIFLVVVVSAILTDVRRKNQRLNNLMAYLLPFSILVGIPYLIAGWAIVGLNSAAGYMLWLTDQLHTSYTVKFVSFGLFNIIKVFKGQATCFITGVDLLADFLRNHDQYVINPRFITLFLSTVLASGILSYFAVKFGKSWSVLRRQFGRVILLSVVWFTSYKLFFNFWMLPSNEEYHITALPPLLILLSLTLLKKDVNLHDWYMDRASLVISLALFSLVLFNNFYGAVLPWYQFGSTVVNVSNEIRSISSGDDLFITTETAFGLGYFAERNVLSLKGIFVGHRDPDQALAAVKRLINKALQDGHKVFIYRTIPSEFTIEDMGWFTIG